MVTWPTSNKEIFCCLANCCNADEHSRTCATEPGVLGKELKKVLDILLKAEIQKNTATIGKNEIERVASLPGGPTPNPQKVLSKTKENIKLQELNTKMTQMITAGPYLSKIVKTK